MSRKEDSKAKDAIVTVNIDDFTRTRDSVSSKPTFPVPSFSFFPSVTQAPVFCSPAPFHNNLLPQQNKNRSSNHRQT